MTAPTSPAAPNPLLEPWTGPHGGVPPFDRIGAGHFSPALEQAMAKAPEPGLAKVAALRLARLLIAQGDQDTALALIAREDQGGPFAADFAALRGDLALAGGRVAEARADYERAIAQGAANAALLQLKLENLPPAG